MQSPPSPSPYPSRPGDGQPVAADALSVGVFVHVDLPWSAHPFAVSDFRIDDTAQLAAVRALAAGQVLRAPADADPGTAAATPLSRHAPRVLAELEQLWADATGPGCRPSAAAAAPPPGRDGAVVHHLDAARCRRQLLEAAREAASLASPPLSMPAAGCREVAVAAQGVPCGGGPQPAVESPAAADTVQAAARLARALSTKLTGVPSAYIRALCEDAAQADVPQVFPRVIRVAVLSLLLARAVELDADALHDVLLGTLLHDVGQRVLAARPGQAAAGPGGGLSDHAVADQTAGGEPHAPVFAVGAARPTHGIAWGGSTGVSDGVLRVLAQHQEQADGHGPGPRLPLERSGRPAQIVALVNHYDTLCRPAPPADGLAPHLALALLLDGGEDRMPFDPPLLRAFGRLMGVYPPGSLAGLSDERYARIVGTHRRRPLRPPVERVAGRETGVDAAGTRAPAGAAAWRGRPTLPLPPSRGNGPAPTGRLDPFAFVFVPAAALSR